MTPAENDAGAPAPMEEDDAASAGVADMSQGYVVEVACMADGSYTVTGPKPMAEPAGDEETYQTLGDALKAVMVVVKENPMQNDNAQMRAGYDAE